MKKKISILVLCVGVILIAVGIFIQVPGDQLTTYSSLDGKDGYSTIEEYVGGDAYNYIIGASLIAGRISGTIAMKSIFIAMGCLIVCIGLVSIAFVKKEAAINQPPIEQTPLNISDISTAETHSQENTIS